MSCFMCFSWLIRRFLYASGAWYIFCAASASNTLPENVRYYLRAGLYAGTMSLVALTSVCIGIPMNLIGQRYNFNFFVARYFYIVASKLFDVTVQVEGEEYLSEKPAVFVCNHQSMLDVLFVGRIFPTRTSMMAKKSLQYTPLGPFMHMSGSIFIDRGNTARAMSSMNAAVATMKRESVGLWVFPEGTRHCEETPSLLPFKKGGFHLAVQAQIPVIPIVAENYWHLYRSGRFGTGSIRVRVLPPVQTAGSTAADVNDLATRVRDNMLVALQQMSTHAPTADQTEDDDSATITKGRGKYSSPTPQPSGPSPPSPSESTLPKSPSKDSLASSSPSIVSQKRDSENGADTEEDEGMVLVGRPAQ